jgi:hypothetical protein
VLYAIWGFIALTVVVMATLPLHFPKCLAGHSFKKSYPSRGGMVLSCRKCKRVITIGPSKRRKTDVKP